MHAFVYGSVFEVVSPLFGTLFRTGCLATEPFKGNPTQITTGVPLRELLAEREYIGIKDSRASRTGCPHVQATIAHLCALCSCL